MQLRPIHARRVDFVLQALGHTLASQKRQLRYDAMHPSGIDHSFASALQHPDPDAFARTGRQADAGRLPLQQKTLDWESHAGSDSPKWVAPGSGATTRPPRGSPAPVLVEIGR